ncbi:MAG: transporter, partial [Microbacteriaceae bacterium]|nr:transporter [Microbacteriaceae bacterium]
LKNYSGGFIVISHDVELVGETVNRVFYLDANRQQIDIYNMGWKHYQRQRASDEERRKKERVNVEKKAGVLQMQAARFGAKASKAAAAHQMVRRAEKMLAGLEEVRSVDRVAKLRFPEPAPCGKTPLMASNLSKSYGSLEIFTSVDLAIDRGSKVVVLGFNGAGKTTLLRILAGVDDPDTGKVEPGHGLRIGYYAQEHETIDVKRSVLENMVSSSPNITETEARRVL